MIDATSCSFTPHLSDARAESNWWSDPPGGRAVNAHGDPPYDLESVAARIHVSLEAEEGDILLDLGCGQGRMLEWMRKRYHCGVVGIDSSWRMVKDARAATNATIFYTDGRRLPDDLPPIHHAYAITVFQHLEHNVTRSYIKQIRDLLPHGGRFVFTHSLGDDPPAFLHHQIHSFQEPLEWLRDARLAPIEPLCGVDELGWAWYVGERKS